MSRKQAFALTNTDWVYRVLGMEILYAYKDGRQWISKSFQSYTKTYRYGWCVVTAGCVDLPTLKQLVKSTNSQT